MSLLPTRYLDAVVALETLNDPDDPDDPDEEPDFEALGSGVLVEVEFPDADNQEEIVRFLFLVTARHVVVGQDTLYAKINAGPNATRYVLSSRDDEGPRWYDAEGYDVAVTLIDEEQWDADGVDYTAVLPGGWLDVGELLAADVGAGDEVFVCGFPLGLSGVERKYSIVRGGIIARLDADVIEEARGFMIDCNVFPGNSGGPVFLKPLLRIGEDGKTLEYGTTFLIGIVDSYLPYHDEAVSVQTGNTRVVFEENSGLATVVPVDAIAEAISDCLEALASSDDDDTPPTEGHATKPASTPHQPQ
ncbi:serine protease [Solirubrobacter phytolaccae]|uniref:Serine protease n=1 Tax=Solirubrobacter phytolaccae TaxID=1404360 RepID=A0A9X3SD43_9ACTN|nr:serine protease [Solirubrobacter phytolaccae]MDA0179342.1 serine protease [Solirubrobacter phytolaccae]